MHETIVVEATIVAFIVEIRLYSGGFRAFFSRYQTWFSPLMQIVLLLVIL
jgi:hypothetical protein